jgi:Peptidase U49
VVQSPEETLMMTMIGAAPERESEIRFLWQQYRPSVVVEETGKFRLDATGQAITIDVKVPDVFWLIGFSGWHAIETYIPAVMTSTMTNTPVADVMRDDEMLPVVERDYKERIRAAHDFLKAKTAAEAPWPPDIPRPSSDRNAVRDNQYEAAFDLTTSAVAFAIFHEFYHVILDQDHKRPKERPEEELACDVWAREFVTVKLEAYARSKGFDYSQVMQRRAMALSLAALILHEITPEWERGGNCDYFSVATRIQTILDNTPLPADSHFWNFAAALLIGMCRQRQIPIDAPAMTARELASHLLGRI